MTTSPRWRGRLEGIWIAEVAGVEMHELATATAIAGIGLEGDRYATRQGHYSHMWHEDRQVTIIADEVLQAIENELDIRLERSETRRNLVTTGVPLNDLVGERFTIGEVELYGGRLNVPCRYFERLIDKPVFEPLIGRAGLNCRIIRGGTLRAGDAVLPGPATA
ncbi:MOSC domain-containing protein [Microbacterium sp. LMI12-1-1.1]|uniref:MOSC domain-containing protein n=1 Tax=unclassified Microbacterium TaxID=2609290 RepID=UPI003415F254